MVHASQRRRRRHAAKDETRVPGQELSDVKSLLDGYELEDTRDIARPLSQDAHDWWCVNTALAKARASLDGPSQAWRTELHEHAMNILRRRPSIMWPLSAADVPEPNFFLSEEVEALHHSSAQGPIWMAVQAALHDILTHVQWMPPSTQSSASVHKDAQKCAARPEAYKAEALRTILGYKSWNLERAQLARSLTWRDVLQAALASCNPALMHAAEQAMHRVATLYHAQPLEVRLERRTWSVEHTRDIQRRAEVVRRARHDLTYDLMEHVHEALRGSCVLGSQQDASTRTRDVNAEQAFLWSSDASESDASESDASESDASESNASDSETSESEASESEADEADASESESEHASGSDSSMNDTSSSGSLHSAPAAPPSPLPSPSPLKRTQQTPPRQAKRRRRGF